MYRDRFIEIDAYVGEGLNKAKQECSQGKLSRSKLTRAYAGLVTFNLEVTEIAKAYNKEISSVEKLGLLISKDIASSELRICVSQTVG